MKFVVNMCFGGFDIKQSWLNENGFKDIDSWNDILRTDEKVINAIESGENIGKSVSRLAIVEIPNEATDWRIEVWDGWETVWCVLDGKMKPAEVMTILDQSDDDEDEDEWEDD